MNENLKNTEQQTPWPVGSDDGENSALAEGWAVLEQSLSRSPVKLDAATRAQIELGVRRRSAQRRARRLWLVAGASSACAAALAFVWLPSTTKPQTIATNTAAPVAKQTIVKQATTVARVPSSTPRVRTPTVEAIAWSDDTLSAEMELAQRQVQWVAAEWSRPSEPWRDVRDRFDAFEAELNEAPL